MAALGYEADNKLVESGPIDGTYFRGAACWWSGCDQERL